MPIFSSPGKINSGIPLGGLGTGKFEILPSGVWNAFTFLNNWTSPLSGNASYPGVLGFHLGVSVRVVGARDGIRKSFLLQTVPIPGIQSIRSIRYAGEFPQATLDFLDPELEVKVSLKAAGPFDPASVERSSLPGACFELCVINPKKKPVEVSLFFMGRNIMGSWNVGRRNRVIESKELVQIEFSHTDPFLRDPRSGSLLFSFSKKGWQTSFWECWNAVKENFRLDPEAFRMDAWKEFEQTGRLPNRRGSQEAMGENREWCSAVASTAIIPPRGSRVLNFTAAWHIPKADEPSRYEKKYKNPQQVHAELVLKQKTSKGSIKAFHKTIHSFPFPGWFNDALINSLYPFTSSTRFLKNGGFAFYEAPVACPLAGTVDVGFYGSIPLAWFFSDLSKAQLRQFSKAQRADGYIPHDLGRERLDRPSDGTTPLYWKDLNPKFVLMVWRDYAWSSDLPFLKELYPAICRALRWTAQTDTNGDGLPDHEGPDQTFDLWNMKGPQAYTASIYLAALKAGSRMAQLKGDKIFRIWCEERYREASRTFETKLWNGRFFGPTCSIGQLAGQWYADLTGLGEIADPKKMRIALESIRVQNSKFTRFGWVNSTLSDGRLDLSDNHTKNVWYGMNFAYVSLSIARGCDGNKLLKPLQSLWDNLNIQGQPWNQPDMVDAKSGNFIFGDAYYRNMAIWSIPIASAQHDRKLAGLLSRLKAQNERIRS